MLARVMLRLQRKAGVAVTFATIAVEKSARMLAGITARGFDVSLVYRSEIGSQATTGRSVG